jgi:hypothetical protein
MTGVTFNDKTAANDSIKHDAYRHRPKEWIGQRRNHFQYGRQDHDAYSTGHIHHAVMAASSCYP